MCVSHDKRDVLFWSQGILESPRRNVYVFFGNLSDLLGGHVRTDHDDRYSVNRRLVEDGVLEHLEDFTIVLPALTYDVSDVEKVLLEKVRREGHLLPKAQVRSGVQVPTRHIVQPEESQGGSGRPRGRFDGQLVGAS